MTSSIKNKHAAGAIVKNTKGYIAIITKSIPYVDDLRMKLDLEFIGKTPGIYYCISDGWEVIEEASDLIKELF